MIRGIDNPLLLVVGTDKRSTMPLIPGKLKNAFKSIQSPLPATTHDITFLTPPANHPLQPLQQVHPTTQPPPGSLIIALTHPDPSRSPATAFFLSCIPDPCLTTYYSALLIHRHLVSSSETGVPRWRTRRILLELEDKDGLAATSGGRIAISLRWVGNVMRDVQAGKRAMDSAAQEFKGVSE